MTDDPDLLRAIIVGTTDGVFVKNLDGRYIFCNEGAALILGRRVDEIVGHTDHELFPVEVADEIRAIDHRILASGTCEMFEESDPPQREPRLMSTKKFPYRDRAGTIIGIIAIARDITDVKRAEEAVQKEERLLRLVIDALPIGVAVVDSDGDIVKQNRTAERIWGQLIEPGEARWELSQGWWHDSGVKIEPHEWASVRALVEGVECLDQIVDIEAFDGIRRSIRNSSVPILGANGIEGALILNEDITDRLRLESRLAQAQKMEALGRLAGGVAHDFNNLLMVIHTYADLVIDTFVTADPRRADLEEIRRAAESATALTRQLLALGRRDISKPRSLSLEAAVVQTEKMLKRVIGPNIRLMTQLADPPNTVWMDPLQIEQIIVNLAVNARDAMPGGGDLEITTRTVDRTDQEAHLSGRPCGGPVALLSVRDTGTGMDEHTRSRIFEPFFTTKDRSRGTGLGLSIVYSMVEQNGGAIRLFTAPGQGTTFEIDLPISAGVPAARPEKTETVLPKGTETVLVVEDSAPVRVAVCSILMKLGYEVHDFVGAIEALSYLAEGGACDLLLTDLVLEGANGRDLADQVVARRPACRVLFMSGYADDPTRKARPLSPEIPILTKPFSADVLARAVRDALDVAAGSAATIEP